MNKEFPGEPSLDPADYAFQKEEAEDVRSWVDLNSVSCIINGNRCHTVDSDLVEQLETLALASLQSRNFYSLVETPSDRALRLFLEGKS